MLPNLNKLERQLSGLKEEQESIRLRRRELMFRLKQAGFTLERIGGIYGCSKQFVVREIGQYEPQNEPVAVEK